MSKLEKAEKIAEELVKVEMTKEEKEAFVAFKLKQEEGEAAKKSEKRVRVTLKFEHRVAGIGYRPGTQLVPESLVGHFEAAEQRALEARIKVHSDDKHLIHILGPGMAKITHGGSL